MPINYQHIEITLEGLSEFDTPIARAMGKLDIAENLEVVDSKALRKRRGYRFVDLAEAVNIFDTDSVYTRVVNYNGRLIIFSYSYVVELGSRAGAMRGSDTVVYRGPANRGNGGIRSIAVSRTSQNVQ